MKKNVGVNFMGNQKFPLKYQAMFILDILKQSNGFSAFLNEYSL